MEKILKCTNRSSFCTYSLITLTLIYLLVLYYELYNHSSIDIERDIPCYARFKALAARNADKFVIVVVICGQRIEEALVMMKSAIVFQESFELMFVILAEFSIQTILDAKLRHLRYQARYSFSYELRNLSFPANREKEWKSLFKPCAAQRLFLPDILTDIRNVLYVDTDVIFLNDISDIWHHFYQMNSSQIAALVPEHEDVNVGWYNRFARHPYYGKLGVNSAVMLMNLTKMREFGWVDLMDPILSKYKFNLTWGDQDIINIVFHYHPDKLHIYPCRFNYRPDHCMYKSMCKDAEIRGVSVVHGSRGTFHSNKQRAFRAIYDAFDQYELYTDIHENLLEPLRRNLKNTTDTNCGALMNVFIKNIAKFDRTSC